MHDATQAQPPAKLPAYVRWWVWSRVEVTSTRGREHGTVSDARQFRGASKMVVRLNVLLDSGGMMYAYDTEVIRIAPPDKRNVEIAAYGQPPAADATETGSADENQAHSRDANSARDSV